MVLIVCKRKKEGDKLAALAPHLTVYPPCPSLRELRAERDTSSAHGNPAHNGPMPFSTGLAGQFDASDYGPGSGGQRRTARK